MTKKLNEMLEHKKNESKINKENITMPLCKFIVQALH